MTTQGFHLTPSRMTAMNVSASTLDGLTASLSDGFYTTFSTLSGGTRVLGLTAHLKRLYEPAQNLGLHPSVDSKKLRQYLAELTRQSLPNESRLRLIMTKDTGDIYVGVQPFVSIPDAVYREGVHVITREMARHDPRIKGTDFIAQSTEQRKLLNDDVYEILLVRNREILEGMTSNFYAISGKTLVTAQKGILLGVTRRAVLRLARGQGMSIEYRSPGVDENFNEAFLTSSSRGVVPIVKINGKPVGQGRVEAWTKTLSLAYQAYVIERSEAIV